MRKHVSMNEVAYVAGVSIATVSRYINTPEQVAEETRLKVESAIRETGYTPNTLAQKFRRGRSQQIFVAVPSVGDPYFSAIMRGVRRAATERGYTVFIRETRQERLTSRQINAILNSRQADGVVLFNNMTFVADKLDPSADPLARPPAIHVDNVAAAGEMTDYLIGLGHRSIALIFSDRKPSFIDRERGFRRAMQAAGLDIPARHIVDTENSLDGGRAATRALLRAVSVPTAIFCASDELALGCMHELRDAGHRVPEDVSVAGFDDTRYAEVSNPPLTTIRHPAEEMGTHIIEELCRLLDDEQAEASGSVTVPHQLVIRHSVARKS
ncbi:MAG: LacI family DNA-binding transcriptional regulator [Woeseiaceae bacterium]